MESFFARKCTKPGGPPAPEHDTTEKKNSSAAAGAGTGSLLLGLLLATPPGSRRGEEKRAASLPVPMGGGGLRGGAAAARHGRYALNSTQHTKQRQQHGRTRLSRVRGRESRQPVKQALLVLGGAPEAIPAEEYERRREEREQARLNQPSMYNHFYDGRGDWVSRAG